LPNAAIYPLRFASGGFFLLEYVTFVILAKARIQILNQVENDRENVFSASLEPEREFEKLSLK